MAQVKHDVTRAVQKAIQDSTDATNGDVAAFLRSLLEQGFYVAEIRPRGARIDGTITTVEEMADGEKSVWLRRHNDGSTASSGGGSASE